MTPSPPRPSLRSPAFWTTAVAVAAFAPSYAVLAAVTGERPGALTAALILAAGWLLGMRMGVVVGFTAPLAAIGVEHMLLGAPTSRDVYLALAGLGLGPIIGGICGRLRDVLASYRAQIQELKDAQDALERSEARWRALVEHTPATITTCDRDGIITFINRTMTGRPVEEVIGTSGYRFMAEEDLPAARERFRRVFENGEMVEQRTECTMLDGSKGIYVTRHAPIYQDGRIVSSVLITRDVTQLEQLSRLRTRLLEQLMSVREQERHRLAQELHDGIGQALTSTLMGLRVVADGPLPADVAVRVADLRVLTRNTLDDLRRLARGLHPSVLDDVGLVAALERYLQDVERLHGLDADLQLVGPPQVRLPGQLELAIYRIVQEAVHNVVRHAGARSASIVLELTRGNVQVVIEDDGHGCEVDPAIGLPRNVGLGLIGIRERAATFGGTATVESMLGRGTTLYVRVPIEPQGPGAEVGLA